MKLDSLSSLVRWRLSPLASVAIVGLVGCAAQPGDPGEASDGDPTTTPGEHAVPAPEENLGTTQQAFSWGLLAYHDSSSGFDKDLGSSSGKTCFLAGVGGNLFASSVWTEGSGSVHSTAVVDVYEYNGRWFLRTDGGFTNAKVWGAAMCVNSVSGRTVEMSWTGGAAKDLGSSTSTRRCYLTGVSSYGARDDFSHANDRVKVYELGGRWYLGGEGEARGSARCIAVSDSYLEGGWFGDYSGYLAPNPGGVQCALTEVAGTFRSDSYSAKVGIRYNSGLRKWYLDTTSGRGASGQCFL